MKTDKSLATTSKFLRLVLRHQPEVVGMQLDEQGWLDINDRIASANKRGNQLTSIKDTTSASGPLAFRENFLATRVQNADMSPITITTHKVSKLHDSKHPA